MHILSNPCLSQYITTSLTPVVLIVGVKQEHWVLSSTSAMLSRVPHTYRLKIHPMYLRIPLQAALKSHLLYNWRRVSVGDVWTWPPGPHPVGYTPLTGRAGSSWDTGGGALIGAQSLVFTLVELFINWSGRVERFRMCNLVTRYMLKYLVCGHIWHFHMTEYRIFSLFKRFETIEEPYNFFSILWFELGLKLIFFLFTNCSISPTYKEIELENVYRWWDLKSPSLTFIHLQKIIFWINVLLYYW